MPEVSRNSETTLGESHYPPPELGIPKLSALEVDSFYWIGWSQAGLVLSPLCVLASAGVYLDFVALIDKERDLDDISSF